MTLKSELSLCIFLIFTTDFLVEGQQPRTSIFRSEGMLPKLVGISSSLWHQRTTNFSMQGHESTDMFQCLIELCSIFNSLRLRKPPAPTVHFLPVKAPKSILSTSKLCNVSIVEISSHEKPQLDRVNSFRRWGNIMLIPLRKIATVIDG